MSLTEKRERFCHEFIVDGNALQAAIRAGYSASSAGTEGHRLLKNAQVQSRISELRGDMVEKLVLTKEKVLQDIETGKDHALKVNQVGPYMRGCELQGKELGMFVDRTEHLHRMSDEDLIRQIEVLSPEMAGLAREALALPGECVEGGD